MKSVLRSRLNRSAWKSRRSFISGILLFGMHLFAQEPADVQYDESQVPFYVLPQILEEGLEGNGVMERRRYWESSRRNEILDLMERHVYGRAPRDSVRVQYELLESSNEALGGLAWRRQYRVTLECEKKVAGSTQVRSHSLEMLIYVPTKANRFSCGVPGFMGLNFYGNQTVNADPDIRISREWMRGNAEIGIVDHRATERTRGVYSERWSVEEIIRRGYGLVTAYYGDIDPDNYRHDFSDGVHPLFYAEGQTRPEEEEWGAIGAWAWGLSRMLDAMEKMDEPLLDPRKIAVMGHSRLGKTALWAGATDPRFALVISNNSGCGGAALYRRCFGERIHHMLKPVGYWFCLNHARYAMKEQEMPVDQHFLMALMAPRPLYVASAVEDRWADPKGEFLSLVHASPVYELYGVKGLSQEDWPEAGHPVGDRMAYHVRKGDHGVTRYDWDQYLDFADRHLK